MKILRGNLTETRFEFPQENEEEGPMTVISEKTYKENAVAYMADELGLHRVSNKGSDFAVSLHRKINPTSSIDTCREANRNYAVYTPPNVAREGCNIFDEKTGRSSHVPGCLYYSAFGRLLKE